MAPPELLWRRLPVLLGAILVGTVAPGEPAGARAAPLFPGAVLPTLATAAVVVPAAIDADIGDNTVEACCCCNTET
jgi:hypothetical protein